MTHKTAEQRAQAAFPSPVVTDIGYKNMRIGYATCIREQVEPLEAEIDKINAVLNHRAINLPASEAVKWLHDEYTAMCTPLQECCQRHRLGLGGENVAKVAIEAVDRLEAWKESAIKVMGEWDKVWTALGNPGKVGESMAASSLAEVVRLRALAQVLVDGLNAVATLADVDTDDRATIARDPLAAAKEHGIVPTNTTEG